ncbi:MAG: filamentous hemagglutinin N-terminal domain-containing protein, partial [Ancalomicrobiaceae bacterium]|nr:filamentous hemagglutinin N-terminal domain-containing protein [Ancalomicrobiaceae bacterium]
MLASTALTSTLLILAGIPNHAVAQSLPTGGTVISGTVSINQTAPNKLIINQTSGTAITNWQSFSIGAGNSVAVVQPSTASAMLARVTGTTTSTIAGSLTTTGQLMLVNPNGISITSTGTVDAGAGFVATTLGISDADFIAGKRTLTGNDISNPVTNAGTITVGPGGYAALIGGTVSNSGTLSVPLGRVGLGSGEVATLDFSGDGFLQVGVPTNAPGTSALIANSGKIVANGGNVEIKAAQARDMARQAINLSGIVEARNVSGTDGNITLDGDNGTVAVSGKLNVASPNSTGGKITVTGRDIKLTGAVIDASGKLGGGSIKIGGDREGKGTLTHAATTTIDSATTIKADATLAGNGGTVVVWSDSRTEYAGWISAKGGPLAGDGGAVEVSSHGVLAYAGLTVLTAPMGKTGTLLLDPYNVTISSAADATSPGFTASGDDSIINVATLQTALANANVTISTGTSGTQGGDITIASALTWSANTLTLDAYHSIAINATVTIAGTGGLTLTTNDGGTLGDYSFGLGPNGFAGRVDFTGTPGAQALTINGTAYTLLYAFGDLANLNSSSSGTFALASNVDASQTSFIVSPVTSFAGTLTGLGHTISGLTIDNSDTSANVGLIGALSGTVRDIGLVGGRVVGRGDQAKVGALVGYLAPNGSGTNPTVIDAYASTSVTGSGVSAYIGGLIGEAKVTGTTSVTVSNVHATGPVVATGAASYVGGLIGFAYTAGSQTGTLTISNAYATGTVTGGANAIAGGLLGGAIATGQPLSIDSVYATGMVSAISSSAAGGLIGEFDTQGASSPYSQITLTNAFATGAVIGNSYNGGLIGMMTVVGVSTNTVNIGNVFATGAVTGPEFSTEGGLIGLAYSGAGGTFSISNAYAMGAVTGGTLYPAFDHVGGFLGQTNGSTSIQTANVYWNTETSGTGTGVGQNLSGQIVTATGLTTAQLQGALPSGFQSADWGAGAGLYPYLTSIFANGVQAVSGTVYKDAGNTIASSGQTGAVTVSLDAGGQQIATATTGANGVYYAFVAAGTYAPGATILATVATGPRAVDAATLAQGTVGSIAGVDLYGNALRVVTSATLFSQAPHASDAPTVAGTDTAASGVLAALAGAGVSYIAGGTSFTIDQAVDVTGNLTIRMAGAGAPLTVASAMTVENGASLSLVASGALNINAPITAKGYATVNLAYDSSLAGNLSYGLTSAGFTGSLTFTKANGTTATSNQGGALT